MSESKPTAKGSFSIDWLVKGTLTKIGDIFDKLTGRGWKPSSSLATSELIERMKSIMDAEVRESEKGRKYVPHNIKLKMQWDKFSTDSESSLRKLENEFLVAAVDHINDKHYFTHAPLSIEVKPDYFTTGVKLLLSFDKLETEDNEASLDVTLDGLKAEELIPNTTAEKPSVSLKISFVAGGKPVEREFLIREGQRLAIGRTTENDIPIDDQSISKVHGSIVLNKDRRLIVADTGSTNGTFVRGERIAYGKAVELSSGDDLRFGLVKVDIRFVLLSPDIEVTPAKTESYKVGEFEFSSRTDIKGASQTEPSPPPTVAAIPVRLETVPATEPSPEAKAQSTSEKPSKVATQPSVTETRIDLDKEKQDWEV